MQPIQLVLPMTRASCVRNASINYYVNADWHVCRTCRYSETSVPSFTDDGKDLILKSCCGNCGGTLNMTFKFTDYDGSPLYWSTDESQYGEPPICIAALGIK